MPQLGEAAKSAKDSVATAAADSLSTLQGVTKSVLAGNTASIDFGELVAVWLSKLVNFGIRVVIALIVFYVGRRVLKWFVAWFRRRMTRRSANPGLISFLASLFKVLFYVLILIVSVNILGFESVSFAALLAAAGVAIGAALSGQLQNLAAGVVLLVTKPFKVGDYIEAQGIEGTVSDIAIFYTTLKTIDNSSIYMPNARLTTDKLRNTSDQTTRRCQWVMGVEYGTDLEKAKAVMLAQIAEDNRILPDIPVLMVLRELSESSVKLMLRAWCKNDDYWALTWEVNDRIYKAFQEQDIPFAFPSLKVYSGDVPVALSIQSNEEAVSSSANED